MLLGTAHHCVNCILLNEENNMNKQLIKTTNDLLNSPLFRYGVGFDRDLLDTTKTFISAGYPPYDLTRINSSDSDVYEITMAVAGFKSEDIDITVNDRVLCVEGKRPPKVDSEPEFEVEYLHKGIAARDFTHNFRLAENVEVKSATMRDGLLIITLIRMTPDSAKPKKIKIR